MTISLTRCGVIRRVERNTIQEVVRSPRHLLRDLPSWSVESLSGEERKINWLVGYIYAGLSRKRYWRGPRSQEVGERTRDQDHFALRPQKRGCLLGGGSTADTARKRPERLWTAARTVAELRRCPLAISQRLVHCAIAVSTAVLGRATRAKENSVSTAK